MGNVCTKGDASVSALDTTYSREDLCSHRRPRNKPAPCLEKDFSASALEVSTPASSTATFCSIQVDGNSMSAGANASGKDTAENQRSAIDIQILSRSGSAFSLRRKRADPSESPPHPAAVLDADVSGADTTTDKLFSGSMGPTTHHTVSGDFGQRTPGASSLADDTGLGGVVKATAVKATSLRDAAPPTTDHEPTTHPNAIHCATETEEQTAHDSEEFESRSIHFSAPASPLANPLQMWRNGTGSGLTDGHTPSTHGGPALHSNSSSVVEREAIACDVHIEVDSSSLSETSCGFEVMLRALQPPTAAERAEAIRHWADLVPTATPIV